MKNRTPWLPVLALLAAAAFLVAGCETQQAPVKEETPPPAAEAPKPPRTKPKPSVTEEAAPKPAEPSVTTTREEKPPVSAAEAAKAATSEVKPGTVVTAPTPALKAIHFDYDKALLTPEAQETLKGNRDFLLANPDVRIRIEGHCDERGTNEYNLALGERRANAARRFLADLGVDPNRMEVISYGEERPADPASNEAAWAKNRRDEFKKLN